MKTGKHDGNGCEQCHIFEDLVRREARGGIDHDRHQIQKLRGRVDLADDRRPSMQRAEPHSKDECAQPDKDVACDRGRSVRIGGNGDGPSKLLVVEDALRT